jgi:hypothetical protein
MCQEETGLRPETLAHAVKLFNRVVARCLANGYLVNTGLFCIAPLFRGVVEHGVWDPERNSVGFSVTQDKELREVVAEASVHVLGKKGDVMYTRSGEDMAMHETDGTATAGRCYTVYGKMLKVEGEDPSVGVSLTNEETGEVTQLGEDLLVVNQPSRVMVQLPDDLPEGRYTLAITTQYCRGKKPLKKPRAAVRSITVRSGPRGKSLIMT